MKQLILESFVLIFGSDYVSTILMSGITFLAAVVSVLAILRQWGRYT